MVCMVKSLESLRDIILREKRVLSKTLVLLAVTLFVASGWAWWHYVRSNPDRVFWATVDNSLRTQSFARTSTQTEGGQTYIQRVYTTVSPTQIVSGVNEIKQEGTGGFDVVSDIIGTPRADYIRYRQIKTDQKSQDGKALDYSKIINVWGKSESATGPTSGQNYNQSALGVVPFGDLSLSQRRELQDMMRAKSVYRFEANKVTRKKEGGRPLYVYTVTVNAENYITVLKKYASMVGLTQLDQTNPGDFKTTEPLQFKLSLDVWTHRVTRVEYSNGRVETYANYGMRRAHLAKPTNAIGIDELQQRVQSVQ